MLRVDEKEKKRHHWGLCTLPKIPLVGLYQTSSTDKPRIIGSCILRRCHHPNHPRHRCCPPFSADHPHNENLAD